MPGPEATWCTSGTMNHGSGCRCKTKGVGSGPGERDRVRVMRTPVGISKCINYPADHVSGEAQVPEKEKLLFITHFHPTRALHSLFCLPRCSFCRQPPRHCRFPHPTLFFLSKALTICCVTYLLCLVFIVSLLEWELQEARLFMSFVPCLYL